MFKTNYRDLNIVHLIIIQWFLDTRKLSETHNQIADFSSAHVLEHQ